MRVEGIPLGCEWQRDKVQIFSQFEEERPSGGSVWSKEMKSIFG